MSFSARWHTLLEECEALPEGATLITPLSDIRFRITDVQEHRIIIEFVESGESDAEAVKRCLRRKSVH